VSQIVSGILLAMHYQGSASFAFASVEHKIKYLIIIYVFLGNLSLIKFYYYRNNYSIQDAFSDNTLILDLNKKISNIAPAPRLIE
jgi:quinol-cytochrome oxidoreductase complex cytochrome b subunit